jgi:predicted nucleic acid-binding Zn ribbon protein
MKIKKCFICEKKLTGIRTKFCGDICYLQYKADRAKRQSELMRRKNPQRECTVCGEKFFPLRTDVTACSRPCSTIQARTRQQEKRDKARKLAPVKPMAKRLPVMVKEDHSKFERVKVAKFHTGDPNKQHVLQYLQNGGTILRFPEEPRAKIPEVNVPFYRDFDELMGFGLEMESEEQVVVDAL